MTLRTLSRRPWPPTFNLDLLVCLKNILILINIITCVKITNLKIVVILSYHFPDIENQIFCTKKLWNCSNDFFLKIQWDIVRLCTVNYNNHYYLLYDCFQKTESLFWSNPCFKVSHFKADLPGYQYYNNDVCKKKYQTSANPYPQNQTSRNRNSCTIQFYTS